MHSNTKFRCLTINNIKIQKLSIRLALSSQSSKFIDMRSIAFLNIFFNAVRLKCFNEVIHG